MTVLVTGGAGYIGSHTVVELLNQNIDCVVIDNFSNSYPSTINRIETITKKKVKFLQIDMLSKEQIKEIFKQYPIESVIHFAGFKSVIESIQTPLSYYQNNLISTINLLDVMNYADVKNLVFSSTATVYGNMHISPLSEDLTLNPPNPYGRSKYMLEEIMRDLCHSDSEWSIAFMRYFNPIGAHESGIIGEKPNGIANNLMPHILNVAKGLRPHLQIYGNDYPTKDGTGMRDFIHIMDLAEGHVEAVKYITEHNGYEAFNLGTGNGYTVLELIKTFERVNKIPIPFQFLGRREGDIAISIANPTKAKEKLNWQARKTLEDMCRDTWRWELNNNI